MNSTAEPEKTSAGGFWQASWKRAGKDDEFSHGFITLPLRGTSPCQDSVLGVRNPTANPNHSHGAPCLNLPGSCCSTRLQRQLPGTGFPQGGAPVNHLTHLPQKRAVLTSFPTTGQALFTPLLCITKRKPVQERNRCRETKTGLLNHIPSHT